VSHHCRRPSHHSSLSARNTIFVSFRSFPNRTKRKISKSFPKFLLSNEIAHLGKGQKTIMMEGEEEQQKFDKLDWAVEGFHPPPKCEAFALLRFSELKMKKINK
jgi:hypothetical protein